MQYIKLILSLIAIGMALAMAGLVMAYHPVDTVHLPKMPEVVVVEDLNEKDSEQAIVQPEIVLRGDKLRRKREANLGDTLSQELGVTSSSFGPGAGRPIINKR